MEGGRTDYGAVRCGVEPATVGYELLIVDDDGQLTSAPAEDVGRLREQRQLLTGCRRQDERPPTRLRHTEVTRLEHIQKKKKLVC